MGRHGDIATTPHPSQKSGSTSTTRPSCHQPAQRREKTSVSASERYNASKKVRLTTRGDFSEASDHAGVAVCQSEHAEALTGGVAAEQLSAAE